MRRVFLFGLVSGLAVVLGAAWLAYAAREFRLSGTVTIAAHLHRKLPQGQPVLFIIAKNRGGVPVAMQRIVNPQFPASFTLANQDLIVPKSRHHDPLVLEVEMSGHGRAGQLRPGDLRGRAKDLVDPGDRGIHIVIDEEL